MLFPLGIKILWKLHGLKGRPLPNISKSLQSQTFAHPYWPMKGVVNRQIPLNASISNNFFARVPIFIQYERETMAYFSKEKGREQLEGSTL